MTYKLDGNQIMKAVLHFLVYRNPSLQDKKCNASLITQEENGKVKIYCEVKIEEQKEVKEC